MSDWPVLHRPGAMTTSELIRSRDELTRALEATPLSAPDRNDLRDRLAEVIQEQENRKKSELASRGRHQ